MAKRCKLLLVAVIIGAMVTMSLAKIFYEPMLINQIALSMKKSSNICEKFT